MGKRSKGSRKVAKPSIKGRPKGSRVTGIPKLAGILRKYYPKRYPTYALAMERARTLMPEFRSQGLKVTVRNMWLFERKHRVKKSPEGIPQDLLDALSELHPGEPQNYWSCQDWDQYMRGVPDRFGLWFESPLWEGKTGSRYVKAGMSVPDYYILFADFVSFCNRETQARHGGNGKKPTSSEADQDFYITARIPVQKFVPELGERTWVVLIEATDNTGLEFKTDDDTEDFALDVDSEELDLRREAREARKRAREEKEAMQQPQPEEAGPSVPGPDPLALERAKQETLKLQIEKDKTRIDLIREYRSLGFSNEEIKNLLQS